jgi:superfamily II DNA or RNA helicase
MDFLKRSGFDFWDDVPDLISCPELQSNSGATRRKKEFKTEVGVLGGGEWDIKALTVSTYDSAYIHADKLGNRFGLIIFDEVHHLPVAGYRNIAEMFASPYRMGLTAAFEREDGLSASPSEVQPTSRSWS